MKTKQGMVCLVGLITALCHTEAWALNSTWSGGGADSFWGTGANWASGAAPGSTSNLTFNGSTRLDNTNNIAANTQFNGIVFTSGAGAFLLSGNAIKLGGNVTNHSANLQTINIPMALQQTTVFNTFGGSMLVAGGITGSFAVTKEGTNSLTLIGTNVFSGTTVNAGTLNLAPASSNNLTTVNVSGGAAGARLIVDGQTTMGTAQLTPGTTAGDRALVTFSTNASMGKLIAGNASGASGSAIQNGGALSVGPTTGGQDVLTLGNAGGYGYFQMNAGTLTTGQLAPTGSGSGANNGIFDQYGGTVNIAGTGGWLVFGWSGGNGILNLFGGALIVNVSNDPTMGFTSGRNAFGMINLLGPDTLINTVANGTGRKVNMAANAGNVASVINLNNGVLLANQVTASSAATPTFLGFNGGTLKANAGTSYSGSFLQNLSYATLYSKGAVIDTTNNASPIIINQALTAPAGYGLSAVTVAAGGTGYIGAPVVLITGGSGTGATAVAQVDLSSGSPTFGQVTNILVTSAGTGYLQTDTLTATLYGGGFLTPASATCAPLTLTDATGGLTKIGTAALTLGGTNTYNGLTTIIAGPLTASQPAALGTAAGGTVVSNGAALQLQNNIAVTDEPLVLYGTGVSAGGALRNLSGTNAFNGPLSLATAARINSDAGTLTMNSATPVTDAQSLTVGGAGNTSIGTALQTGAGTLTKDGAGTLTLSGANTFAGKTSIQGGTLVAGSLNSVSGGALSSSLGAPATAADGTIDLGSGATAAQLTYTGAGETSDRVLNLAGTTGSVAVDQSGTGLLKFTSDLTATGAGAKTLTLKGSTAGTGELAGAVVNSSGATALAKAGTGTWTLSADNTYSGATAVNGGTLALAGAAGAIRSSASVALTNGATLLLNNTAAANNADRLGDAAPVVMNGGTFGFANDAGTADFGETAGALTLGAAANTVAASQAASSQTSAVSFASLARNAGASVNFTGAGLGADSRNAIFFRSAPTLVNGIIGSWATINGTDWASYDAVRGVTALAGASYTDIDARGSTIPDGAANQVRITAAGSGANIALAVTPTTIATLLQNTATPAVVDTTAQTLLCSGIMIASGQEALTIGASAGAGTLTAASAGGDLVLANSSANDLTVNAVIADNTSASSVTKSGSGRVVLAGANTYNGAATVGSGALNIRSGAALGTTNGATTVASGAALQLQGGITTLAEPLALNGDGVSADGALRNISGNNSFAGPVTLGSDTRINSDSGTLTLTNALSAAGMNLTVGGAGSSTISGVIGIGTGAFTKDGTGTLTLSGANTFSGTVALREGLVIANTINNVSANGTLGNSANPVILGSAGKAVTLRYPGNSGTASKPFTLEAGGTGVVEVATSGQTLTLSGVFDGYGTLTKAGPGILLLSGVSTFVGPLAVREGTLSVGSLNFAGLPGTLGRNADPVAMGANGKTVTFTYTGSTTPNNRRFALAAGGTNNFDVTSTGTILTLNSAISGPGALAKTSAGMLMLSGPNTYSGATIANANGGTLCFANPAALYGDTLSSWTEANIVVNTNAVLAFSVGSPDGFAASDIDTLKALGSATGGYKNGSSLGLDAQGHFTYDSAIENPNGGANMRGFVKTGPSNLTLTASHTFTGPVVIKDGTLTLSDAGGQAYSGNTTIGDGATASAFLNFGASDQLNPAATLNFNGVNGKFAYLCLQGKRQTLNSVLENGGFGLIETRESAGTFGASTVNFNVASGTQSFLGYFRDTSAGFDTANPLTFIKSGAGTLRFGKGGSLASGSASSSSSSHNYSGGTVISNGTVVLVTTNALPASGIGCVVLDGGDAFAGTLDLGGFSHVITTLSGAPGTVPSRIVNDVVGSNVVLSVGINNATNAFAGNILDNSGTGGTIALIKAGTGTQTLSGTNTYSGGTTVTNGTLIAANPTSLPSYDTVGKVLVGPGTFIGVMPGNGTTGWSTAQIDTLRTNTPFATTTSGLAFDTSLGDAAYPSAITQRIAVAKFGINTLTLDGANTYVGATAVNAGTLAFSAASSNTLLGALTVGGGSAGATATFSGPTALGGALIAGNTAGSRSRVASTTDLRAGKIQVGQNDNLNSAGAVYQLGGTITSTNASLSLAEGIGSYGSYRLVSGFMQATVQSDVNIATKGNGVLELFGGTFNLSSAAFVGKGGAAGAAAELNVFGGVLNGAPTIGNYITMGGATGQSIGFINVGGSGLLNIGGGLGGNRGLGMMYADNNTNIINVLPGGTIIANKVYAEKTTGQSIFNFNGGTLATTNTSTAGAAFMQGLTAAYIYPNGATIDSTNVNVTIAQPLLGPTGYGVASLGLTANGTGYIGTPVVAISGGSGSGASALAQWDSNTDSPTYGAVTNLLITSPGSGYQAGDTLTVTFKGGGCLTPAAATATLGLNANTGGLTKIGPAILTLSGTNTYGGATTISNGTLRLGRVNALPTNAVVTVAGGVYDLNGFSATNGLVNLVSGSVINGTLYGALAKGGSGTATVTVWQASAGPITVSSGTLQMAALQPGLYEGRVNGSFDTTTANPQTAVRSSTTNANVYYSSSANSGGIWIDNSTYIYTGYLWNKSTTNEVWSFSKTFDDSVLLKIDNVSVLNNGTSSATVISNYTLIPGPHPFELRLGQGGGGVGPNVTGWNGANSLGVGFDRLGRGQAVRANFQPLADPGDGSLLTLTAFSGTNLFSADATLVVAQDAALNLGGSAQSFSGISGSGLVTNGTLIVTGVIAPGGTNVIGTLTTGPIVFSGATLLTDVANNGTSDKLVVQGDLNLAGLQLQIANPGQLNRLADYVIGQCTGALSGDFSSTNLTGRWFIRLDQATKTVHLSHPQGTLIKIL